MARPTPLTERLGNCWIRLWMRFSGTGPLGRIATRIAALRVPPYKSRSRLARLCPKGYISPQAVIHIPDLRLGKHVFIGDRVTVYADNGTGSVQIGDNSAVHQDSIIEVGRGGSVSIGSDTHIQPRLQISAYVGSVSIGSGVQIAPNCAFYPYNHGAEPGVSMRKQELTSKGGIVVGDEAWLGYGVVVLDGVTIGHGAIIGAGSVVSRSVPPDSIAVGVPAKVIGRRGGAEKDVRIAVARGGDDA